MTTRRIRSTLYDAAEALLSPQLWRRLLVGAALTCCVVALAWAAPRGHPTPLGLMLLALVLVQVAGMVT